MAQESLTSPKADVRAAFEHGLITGGDIWYAMLEARNITSQVYDLAQAEGIVGEIKERYFDELQKLAQKLICS